MFSRPWKAFLDCPADSVGYAVMERTRKGQTLSDDDIARFDDRYGRASPDGEGGSPK